MAARSEGSSPLVWRKAGRSVAQDECVEVAGTGRSVLIRDSKSPDGTMLTLTMAQWELLVRSIRAEAAEPAG